MYIKVSCSILICVSEHCASHVQLCSTFANCRFGTTDTGETGGAEKVELNRGCVTASLWHLASGESNGPESLIRLASGESNGPEIESNGPEIGSNRGPCSGVARSDEQGDESWLDADVESLTKLYRDVSVGFRVLLGCLGPVRILPSAVAGTLSLKRVSNALFTSQSEIWRVERAALTEKPISCNCVTRLAISTVESSPQPCCDFEDWLSSLLAGIEVALPLRPCTEVSHQTLALKGVTGFAYMV